MEPNETTFDPPAELSEFAQRVWRLLVPRRCRSVESLVKLRRALKAHDEAERCDEQLARDGLLSKAPAAAIPHAHPLVKIRDEQLKTFSRMWTALSLDSADMDHYRDGAWEDKAGIGLPILESNHTPQGTRQPKRTTTKAHRSNANGPEENCS